MRPRSERLAEQIRLMDLLPRAKQELLRYPGVRDVGVGLKETGDLATEQIVFRVYVDQKKRPSELPPDAMIPREVLGVPTDVVVHPMPDHTEDDDKYRPLQGGIQIGNDTTSASGTLGCLAQRNSDHTVVLLSNHHVMLDGDAKIGEKIGQPGISCCCCCKGDIVAEVVDSKHDGLVDCAIARIIGQPGFTNEIQGIGLIFGSAPLNPGGSTVVAGDKVRKRGRTTELTTGTVLNPSVGTGANPAKGIPARTNQIEIKPDPGVQWFQYYGDSGAVLVSEVNVVVGLMWGVVESTKLAYANRITDVVSALDITIIDSGTAGTIPLGAVPSDEEVAASRLDLPGREIAVLLARSAEGRCILSLVDRFGDEINDLLESNREVKVAWHRFHGPAYTADVIQSAREPDHPIPPDIAGVTPANLLIRMSVVLQDNGSPGLAAMVEKQTLPLLELVTSGNRVHDLLARLSEGGDAVGDPAIPAAVLD